VNGTIRILDLVSHRFVGSCAGPSSDGACPRVAVGGVILCAGFAILPEGASDDRTYTVSPQMTLCPRTVAEALAVPSDSPFMAIR
jgi:hypothetical protein